MESLQATFVLSSPLDMITLSQCTESVFNTHPHDCFELKPYGIFFKKLQIHVALWHCFVALNRVHLIIHNAFWLSVWDTAVTCPSHKSILWIYSMCYVDWGKSIYISTQLILSLSAKLQLLIMYMIDDFFWPN